MGALYGINQEKAGIQRQALKPKSRTTLESFSKRRLTPMLVESIIAIAKRSAMSATLDEEIIEQAGHHAGKLWDVHKHNIGSLEEATTWAEGVGRDFARAQIAPTVVSSAQNGARQIAPEQPDLVKEAGQYAGTIWHKRNHRNAGPPIDDAEDWAFTVGKNFARKSLQRQLVDQERFVDINDPTLSKNGSLSCSDPTIERMFTLPRITGPQAVEAIRKLAGITIDTINRNSDHIDIRIFHYHYNRHLTFTVIAREIGISEDAAKKRWWRMVNRTSEDVREIVSADPLLARAFDAILSDEDHTEFRKALMNLLAFMAEQGLSAVEEAAQEMFPPG
jgi:hypothetical protein